MVKLLIYKVLMKKSLNERFQFISVENYVICIQELSHTGIHTHTLTHTHIYIYFLYQ